MSDRNPSDLFPTLGPLRLEGVGALEAARSAATGGRVCVRRVPATPVALEAIDAARKLPRHAGLCPVLDAGTWQGDAWFVTDFPEGQLLNEGTPMAVPELARHFAPLAQALATLHQDKVSLGLLSGAAVLVAADGRWLLHEAARVGVDRATDRRPEQTALAQLHRTSPFFSPQRLKGGPPTPADDVFALGVLLCITSGAALPKGSALEQLHAVMVGTWKPQPPADLPEPLARLLARMLSPDAAARPLASEVALRLATPHFVAPFTVKGPTEHSVDTTPDIPVAIPAPHPTVPGMPSFDPHPFDRPLLIPALRAAAPIDLVPPPAPTVPTPVPPPVHLPPAVQVGGAALTPRRPTPPPRASSFVISIAASDARLVTAGLVALAMLASTVALGAHVVSARQEAAEVAAAKRVRPAERKEPRYNAEQLKQILRQKEEARHEY